MKTKTISMACAIALGLAFAGTAPAALAQSSTPAPAAAPVAAAAPAAPKLHAAMRALWHGHIVATREDAMAVHAGNKAAEKKAQDAEVKNGHDIANAVAGFYGKDAGEGIFKLLAGHVGGVDALTTATKAKNTKGEEKAMSDLAANGMAIAKFLAGANPNNWTVDGLNKALLMHVGDHKQQIDQIMSNAPKAEQEKTWAEMEHHMNMIADALSDGIAKQFPDKAN
jgi:hypothetical protein